MKIKKILDSFKPYYVENKEVPIRLDANESPYDFPEELKKELSNILSNIEINRYPDSNISELRKIISEKENIPEICMIFGNGSDEFIYMLYMCLERGSKVSYPEPGFSMYRIVGNIFEMNLQPYQLSSEDYTVDKENLKRILKSGIDLIFLGNPNNPTGNVFPQDFVEMVLSNKNTIVVSDEAYFNYSQNSFRKFLDQNNNLLIMRSFSKVGLASIRLGYMIGDEHLINKISMVRSPYNINSFTQKIALFYFKHESFFKKIIEDTILERERLYKFFLDQKIFAIPSQANFITFRIEKPNFYDFLLQKGIRIKDLSHSFNMKNFFRVTVGKKSENNIFMSAVKEFLLH
ncbi:MAG: histidinol-phosphate transaminase [Proteobacteria bacterium]|nr:histidinol-phosphate transaminase [Pseudomonadota bacterium]